MVNSIMFSIGCLVESSPMVVAQIGNKQFNYFVPTGEQSTDRHGYFIKNMDQIALDHPDTQCTIVLEPKYTDVLLALSTDRPLSELLEATLYYGDDQIDWIDRNIVHFMVKQPHTTYKLPFPTLLEGRHIRIHPKKPLSIKLSYSSKLNYVYHTSVILDSDERVKQHKLVKEGHILSSDYVGKWSKHKNNNLIQDLEELVPHGLIACILWRYNSEIQPQSVTFYKSNLSKEYSTTIVNKIHEKEHNGMTHICEQWYYKSFDLIPFSAKSSGFINPYNTVISHNFKVADSDINVEYYIYERVVPN